MAEEASTGGAADNQSLGKIQNCRRTTVAELTTDVIETPRPTIQRVSVEVAEVASAYSAMKEQYQGENQNCMKTTITNLPTDYVEIVKPALLRVTAEVAEEASTYDTTNEQCIYEVLDNKKTTDMKLSMELLEIPQMSVTRGSWNWPKRQCFFGGGSFTTSYRNDEADDRASLLDDGRGSRTVG